MDQYQGSTCTVLGSRVNALTWDEVIPFLSGWSGDGASRFVCLFNVHSSVTALDDAAFADALRSADLVLPDGMPIAWVMRRCGFERQERIAGPELMWRLSKEFERTGRSVFLYGSSEDVLERLKRNLIRSFPALKVVGSLSPPYRELSAAEEAEVITRINAAGSDALFVALGCPRQEIWMARQKGKIACTMYGFGAAFEFHAGTVRRAPDWMQRIGMEWLFRLLSEPRRLFKRYLMTNSRFIARVSADFLRGSLCRSR
jgi:N-acetylglucosaminyldiphosphoundecaprenol N-acetyl-beta-D-mannosaminyltransferase